MKKWSKVLMLLAVMVISTIVVVNAQCSICTKSAGQLGEKPARSLNSGIVYLMLTPFAIVGFIGYQWWKSEKESSSES